MTVIIELTYDEVFFAAQIGLKRRVQDLEKRAGNTYNAPRDHMGWQYDIVGALGECAVAKHFGVYWNGNLGDLGAADVGEYEVRTSTKDWGDLIMHSRDKDDSVYILVTGTKNVFTIRGYVKGKDAKKDKYWKDPAGGRPAYFVPQDDLLDIGFLPTPTKVATT